MKQCAKCGQLKDLEEFYKDKTHKDGLQSICKNCVKERVSKYRQQNPEKVKRAHKKAIQNNPLYYKGYRRQYFLKNKRRYQILQKEWKGRNKHKVAAHNKLQQAIANGGISKPDCCKKCGNKGNVEGHHEDYNKPLLVDWLCFSCHREKHIKCAS